ncbi:hypothetical protein CATRI_04480 [Corynebacterium atrinae]|uniref:hypothetical protein n=1 Tax=Corynebacterium atrinae TaxID=1336740 RepID=UPI0025B351F4|nr:hypothetical protein [Corynebacterium atrinae]WJY62991.1 hypothetical protein CATRI_04480 [Corynebacterium atrinae]
MVVPSYPLALPPSGTPPRSLAVERVNQAILFSQLRSAELIGPDGVLIEVTLVPNLGDGGWRIRWEFGIIGSLSAQVRAEYPEIERVVEAGLTPLTRARVSIDRAAGRLAVAVELPEPGTAVPLNNLPPGSVLVPQGELHPLPAELPDGHYLGVMAEESLLIDDRVIPTPHAPWRVRAYGLQGPVGVRVFSHHGYCVVDAGPGQAYELPALPVVEPEPEQVEVLAPGVWAITMDGDELAEPVPAGPRTVMFRAINVEEL